ncbi:hypothetical protein AWZ03_006776 [Drosophila navojoa]|uniref:Uncharacterized protein n=1 Tax=Drosophila navojoa TaxID=7232 RepID=A0A484BF25_DRONA|nr:hypothetical protein AWZ03_006776 [Drosophila navojoa]
MEDVHCPLSSVHCPLSAVFCPMSDLGCLLSAVCCRRSCRCGFAFVLGPQKSIAPAQASQPANQTTTAATPATGSDKKRCPNSRRHIDDDDDDDDGNGDGDGDDIGTRSNCPLYTFVGSNC